jgi:hypothetical protein
MHALLMLAGAVHASSVPRNWLLTSTCVYCCRPRSNMAAHSSTSSSNKLQFNHLVLPASKGSHLGLMQLQRQLLPSPRLSSPVHLQLQLQQPTANSRSSSRSRRLSKQQRPRLRSIHNNQQRRSKGRHHSSSSRLKHSLVQIIISSSNQLPSLLGLQRQEQQQQQQ